MMRLSNLAAFGILAILAACSRPVLYYPAPEGAPAAAGPVIATVAPAPPAVASTTSSSNDVEYLRDRRLLLPVAGANVARLEDTFLEGRDGDRTHRAIDILAPRGTPILSADDGRILRMSTNTLGGISMYTVDSQTRLVYYYAHLDRYNDSMSPGRNVAKGDTLGYVGTTGNAPKDIPHLHFQVMRWPADGKYWNGEPLDPFEALGGLTRAERAERARRGSGQPNEF
jgi:murein DD-endopeptidase MepM/ murein hydrolase activator NlpD